MGFAAAFAAGLAVWLWPAAETEPQRPNSAADPAAATDPAPDPYLAACQTYYTGADGREYHVFTAVTPSIEGRTDPVGYRSELIPAGGTVDFPATVMVQDATTQEDCPEDSGLRSGGFRRAAGQLGRVRHRAGGREPGEAVGRGGGNTGVPGAAVPAAACGSHLHPQRGGLDAAHEERRRAAPDHDRGI